MSAPEEKSPGKAPEVTKKTKVQNEALAKISQDLAEVSAAFLSAKDKLKSKLDDVVARVEEPLDKIKPCFKDAMFDTRREVDRSKGKLAEAQELIEGVQTCITEIYELIAPPVTPETADEKRKRETAEEKAAKEAAEKKLAEEAAVKKKSGGKISGKKKAGKKKK